MKPNAWKWTPLSKMESVTWWKLKEVFLKFGKENKDLVQLNVYTAKQKEIYSLTVDIVCQRIDQQGKNLQWMWCHCWLSTKKIAAKIMPVRECSFSMFLLSKKFQIMCVGFLYAEKIIIRNILLVWAVTFFNILLQFAYWRMKVDQEFRLHHLRIGNFKEALVKTKFILRKIDAGKQKAFGKKIVWYGEVLEKIFLLDQLF